VLAAGVLWGSVTVGPTTPVCRVGTPCSGPAKNATLTFSRAGRVVTAKTDASGRYRLSLHVGTWVVRVNVGMRVAPSSVVVRTGTHRENFAVDTGIR
jgi:hypothetical protein